MPSKPLLKNSLYNPITTAEWEAYFKIANTRLVSEADRTSFEKRVKTMAEESPYARRLIREQVQGKGFALTLTEKDRNEMESSGADGMGFTAEGRISFLPIAATSTLYHEARHIRQ